MRKKHIRDRLKKVISDFSESQQASSRQGMAQWDYEPADMQKYSLHQQQENPLQDSEPWSYEPNSHEKREHPRKNVHVYGIFEAVDNTIRASTMNVSVGGVLIDPDADLPMHEYMFITFFNKKFTMPVRTSGRVVRVGPDGVGIQFEKTMPEMSSL